MTLGSAGREIIAFPDVLVFLSERVPTTPIAGTVLDPAFDLAAISLMMKDDGKVVSSVWMGDPLNVLVWLGTVGIAFAS